MLIEVHELIVTTSTVILPGGSISDESLTEVFSDIPGLRFITMPGSIDLLPLLRESAFVLTDTDEFEAELTVMNVPCLTMRQSIERFSTVEIGTNVLIAPYWSFYTNILFLVALLMLY